MRRALLIAWHDFVKYVTRRGFLIGILLFPVWVFAIGVLPQLLRQNIDTRTFAVVDRAGGYREVIDRELARSEARRALIALSSFAKAAIDLETYGKDEPEIVLTLKYPYDPSSFDDFIAHGGWQGVVDALANRGAAALRAFKPPRPRFALAETPADLQGAADADLGKIALRHLSASEARATGALRLAAVLVVPADFAPQVYATFWSSARSDAGLASFLEDTLTAELRLRAIAQMTNDRERAAKALRIAAGVAERDPEILSSGRPALSAAIGAFLPIILAYVLFAASFSNSMFMLGSVVEEKSTRMVEILVSCASPIEIMTGKLIAGVATSLTTFVLWGGGLLLLALLLWPGMSTAVLEALSAFAVLETAPFILVYFFSGLLIYGAIFLAIGSMAASVSDAQSLSGPATLILFLPYFFVPMYLTDPDGLIPRIISWIPFYSPTFMLMRLPAHPPMWEVWATASLCAATALVLIVQMAKVFEANLLTTERPPQLRKLLARWFVRRT